MPDFKQIALIYEISEECWARNVDELEDLGWQQLKIGFFIEPLQQSITVWRASVGELEANGRDKPAAPAGQVLLLRYFDRGDDTPESTLAVYLPHSRAVEGLDISSSNGLERESEWKMHARRQLGRMLRGHVNKGVNGTNPFQPVGRAAHIHPGSSANHAGSEAARAASQFLRGSNTLGEKEAHWYEPDDSNTKVLGTASGFAVLSTATRFSSVQGETPSQFERFIVLQGLAYAYRQALLAPSRWLAHGLPTAQDDAQTSEECYKTVRRLYDRQIQFEARYLFSSPVEEDKAEVHGMALYVMGRNGLDHLREDLNTQLERLQGLAHRFLAETEADRREQEAKAAARRQRWLNSIVTVLGLGLATSQALFGWLSLA